MNTISNIVQLINAYPSLNVIPTAVMLKAYTEDAARTLSRLEWDKHDAHMAAGFITEIGELLDGFKKALAYSKPLNPVNIQEEWGDIMWYVVNWKSMNAYNVDECISKAKQLNSISPADVIHHITSQIMPMYIDVYADIAPTEYLVAELIQLANGLSFNWKQTLVLNINKLMMRYPEGFSTDRAIHRDLDMENKALTT